jgi:hypothetical protein
MADEKLTERKEESLQWVRIDSKETSPAFVGMARFWLNGQNTTHGRVQIKASLGVLFVMIVG